MTKTMLTVFVLTVVLTACDVLGDHIKSGEEKYCDLDLALKLCMENFNLAKADGKLVTMMMIMIITSTKMMVVVMVIIIMMVAMVVGMLLLVGVMLQMAMVVIAMMTMGIFMMAIIKTMFLPQFVAYNTDCLLMETFQCCIYTIFLLSLILFREDI